MILHANMKIIKFSDLSEVDKKLFNISSDHKLSKHASICLNQKKNFLINYSRCYKSCNNPLKIHQSSIRKQVREVSLDEYKFYLTKFKVVIKPGQKLCINCMKLLNKISF